VVESARVEHDEPGFRIATWRNVVVFVWCGAVTVARLDELRRRERALRTRVARGLVPLTIVTGVPTEMLKLGELERKRAAEISAEMGPYTLAHANVVLGDGFWSATVRSVISWSNLLSKPTYPSRVFDALDPACDWLVAHVEPGPSDARASAREMAALVADLVRSTPRAS
jgi:hypothetical protein